MGVHQFVFPGVITLADGEFEAVLLYLYIKGLREAHAVNFRGFLFAQSAERAWYNWGETGLCQPYVAKDWLPRVWLRCSTSFLTVLLSYAMAGLSRMLCKLPAFCSVMPSDVTNWCTDPPC